MTTDTRNDQDGSAEIAGPWPRQRIKAVCGYCGIAEANLRRLKGALLSGVLVKNALAYVCSTCDGLVSVPHITSGRVFAETARDLFKIREFRMPVEAEDLALAVHAGLGLPPTGDVYAVPICLGLRLAGSRPRPDPAWDLLDRFEASERARPCLSKETVHRLDCLHKAWDARSRADVARRLIVVSYLASLRGFRPETATRRWAGRLQRLFRRRGT